MNFTFTLQGEGHGWPESQFGRIAELDALHVRPKGEGQGCPESNLPFPLFTKEGDLYRTALVEFLLWITAGVACCVMLAMALQ